MTVEIEYDEEQDDEINYMQISWKLREAYEKTDASKTGFVNVNDLKMLLTELDIQIPEDIVEEAIMAADVNEDETNIHFYEFIGALLTDLEDEDDDGDLKRAFSLFEENSKVAISYTENMLRAAGKTLTTDQVNILLENYETETAGFLNFEEFKEVYNATDDLL